MSERVICRRYVRRDQAGVGRICGGLYGDRVYYEPEPEAPSVEVAVEILREIRSGLERWKYGDHPGLSQSYIDRLDALISKLEDECETSE